MPDQSLLSTVRSDLADERDRLEAQIAALEPGGGERRSTTTSPTPARWPPSRARTRCSPPSSAASSTRSSGPWPSSTTAPTASARRAASRSPTARLEAMPAARFCIAPRVGRRWRATSHLVRRFVGSLRPGGPGRTPRGVGRGAPAARRADALAPDVRARSPPRGRGRRAGRAGARARGHPAGPRGRAAPRRRQDRERARHLRPGGRHAVGQGRRRRTWPPPGASSGASPAGSASTSSTTRSAATSSSWPAATRSPSPGPASTTARRPSGPSTRAIADGPQGRRRRLSERRRLAEADGALGPGEGGRGDGPGAVGALGEELARARWGRRPARRSGPGSGGGARSPRRRCRP